MDFTCAILAGGRSRRMGRDKATITVNNKALIQQVYDKVATVFDNITIVSNHHKRLHGIDAPIVRDVIPVQASMVGVISALITASTPYVFVIACDMPFVSVEVIRHMVDQVHGEDVIVPRTREGFEPLHAIYNRSCISTLLTFIERRRLKITGTFPFFSVKEIKDQPSFLYKGMSIFTNITVEEDLALVRRLG